MRGWLLPAIGTLLLVAAGAAGAVLASRYEAAANVEGSATVEFVTDEEPAEDAAEEEVEDGEQLLADDPLIEVDLPAWCHRTGHELLELRRADGEWVGRVRRTG